MNSTHGFWVGQGAPGTPSNPLNVAVILIVQTTFYCKYQHAMADKKSFKMDFLLYLYYVQPVMTAFNLTNKVLGSILTSEGCTASLFFNWLNQCAGVRDAPRTNVGVKIDHRTCLTQDLLVRLTEANQQEKLQRKTGASPLVDLFGMSDQPNYLGNSLLLALRKTLE